MFLYWRGIIYKWWSKMYNKNVLKNNLNTLIKLKSVVPQCIILSTPQEGACNTKAATRRVYTGWTVHNN